MQVAGISPGIRIQYIQSPLSSNPQLTIFVHTEHLRQYIPPILNVKEIERFIYRCCRNINFKEPFILNQYPQFVLVLTKALNVTSSRKAKKE